MKLSIIAASALICAGASWAAPRDVIERTFTVTPGGKLSMNVDRGSVKVTSAKGNQVDVRVLREVNRTSETKARELLDRHKIDIQQAGDTVEIHARAENIRHRWFRNPLNNLKVEYTILVPRNFNLDVHTSGGNISLSNLEGKLRADTSGGNIQVIDAKGDLVARTSGGSIRMESINGSVNAETSGGNIDLSELRGTVKARTSGGNVSAELLDPPQADCTLKTSGGNVTLSLPSNAAVDLNARTSGGHVSSDFGGNVEKSRTKIVAQLNGGGPNVVLETAGGNVKIRKH